ncbi:MAG TPA: HAD-IIA family hydrolase [Actinotalea sp.]|nr:HAD-IIA family hydrolase [Actinotalea sp.]
MSADHTHARAGAPSGGAGLDGSDVPLVEVHDLALVDLDGVAYTGQVAVPHAAESLAAARRAGTAIVFVTNNASREPSSVADQLVGLGIECSEQDVMTAAQAAAELLSRRLAPGSRVLVVGGAGLLTAVREKGFEVVARADDKPAAVVQGFAPEVGWPILAEASYAIADGAWFVASNLDLTLPTERGFAPGNGSLVAVLRSATGVEPVSAGKPEPTMYRLAADRVGATRPLVVGDRLDTDLAGARAAGWPGVHVLTGVNRARDAVLAPAAHRPSYLARDLRDLLVPHPAPALDDGWWRVRGARARVSGGRLEVAPDGDPLDQARAACAAAWDAADSGAPVSADTVDELTVDVG